MSGESKKLRPSFPLSVCFLLFGLLLNGNVNAQEDSSKPIYFERGYKEYHYGIPFLYLEGTDYEVGRQYGHLLKDELKNLYGEFGAFKQSLMAKEIKYLPWWQRTFAHLFGGMVFRHKINAYADRLPADIEDQIRGAAEGAELPESFFREIQVMPDLYAKRCEGIVVIQGDKTYHCHNLDQSLPLNMLSKYPAVVSYVIPGKVKYTNLGFVACFMITTAFNEHGISFSENGNNNPMPFEASAANLYVERNKFITQTHNLKEVDALMNASSFPMGLILTVASCQEKQAVVYDVIGATKAATPVNKCQFIPNRTVSTSLGKKSETIYSRNFHNTARDSKFAELIDPANSNMIDGAIGILSNTEFYHYTNSISVHIESLHNFETDQSVIFDLADSAVYFACNQHFAAWSRWLKYNTSTRQVSVYREADPRLSSSSLRELNQIFTEYELCDWRDSSNVQSVVDTVVASGVRNYFSLHFLSTTYLKHDHLPAKALEYADLLIEKYPDVMTGYYDKGRALEAQNKLNEAIAEYKRALKCKIQCEFYLAETHEHLASTYRSLGMKDAAAEHATAALDIHAQFWVPDRFRDKIQRLEKIQNKLD